jgi:hypothetical protein
VLPCCSFHVDALFSLHCHDVLPMLLHYFFHVVVPFMLVLLILSQLFKCLSTQLFLLLFLHWCYFCSLG